MAKNTPNKELIPQPGIATILGNLRKEHFINEFGIEWELKQARFNKWLEICTSNGFQPASIIKNYQNGETLNLSPDLIDVFEMILAFKENAKELSQNKRDIQNSISQKINSLLEDSDDALERYITNNGIYLEGITPKQAKISFVSFFKKYFSINGQERFIQLILNGDNIAISREITSFLSGQIISGKINEKLKERYLDSLIAGIGFLLESELDGTQEGGLVSEMMKVA